MSKNNNTYTIVGTLVGFDVAAYRDEKHLTDKKKDNFFATVETSKGLRTIWGIHLQSAIAEAGVHAGDFIKLSKTGQEEFMATIFKKDEDGNRVRSQERRWRNVFEVEKLERRQKRSSKSSAKAEKPKQSTIALARENELAKQFGVGALRPKTFGSGAIGEVVDADFDPWQQGTTKTLPPVRISWSRLMLSFIGLFVFLAWWGSIT
ncbi:MAG: hypothetical protein GJ680_18280 [Alteromonadaceae bacterium]|nr:hypothetical protein [Alteromonadaceae bacterium]